MSRSSFTLIELLVVIAVLAILSVAVVLVINPADIIKQSRDSQRLTDLNNLNKALAVFDVTNPDDFTGTSTVVYVSLPVATEGTCPGLPALPAGYTYQCVTSSTLAKADGTGWIPVNFQNISYGSPLTKLPVDPTNSSTTGQYYTYIMGGSWELNAVVESNKYRNDESISKTNLPGVMSVGSNKNLSPIYSTNGLVGYWKLDDNSGTSTMSGLDNSINGTLINGPTWISGKIGNAVYFDGSDDYISFGTNSAIKPTGAFTISLWVYAEGNGDIFGGRQYENAGGIAISKTNSDADTQIAGVAARLSILSNSDALSNNEWTHIFVQWDGTTDVNSFKFYKNNSVIAQGTPAFSSLSWSSGNTVRFGWAERAYLKGRIDDVRIYNRALSVAEMTGIYNATR